MSYVHLPLKYFYSIHQLAILKTFGNEDVLSEPRYTNENIYGYNLSKLTEDEGKSSLAAQLKKIKPEGFTDRYPSGKRLYNYKREYNRALFKQQEFIKIQRPHLSLLLAYVGHTTPKEAFDYYLQVNGYSLQSFKPPKVTVRGDKAFRHVEVTQIQSNITYNENLRRLADDEPYWLYFYEYEGSTPEEPVIMRMLFHIKRKGQEYRIKLLNRGKPYSDYAGVVTHSSSNTFVCDLTGAFKKQTIFISIDPEGTGELWPGIYLKNNRDGRLFAGAVILERIHDPNKHQLNASDVASFKLSKTDDEVIHPAIKNYFKEKSYTLLKVPKWFKYFDIQTWLDGKLIKRGEVKKYDIFISVTILSLERRRSQYEILNTEVKKFIRQHYQPRVPEEQDNLEEQLRVMVESNVLHTTDNEAIPFDWKKLNAKVEELNANLVANVDQITRISYSRKGIDPDTSYYRDPKAIYNEDYENLRSSSVFMLICPYPHIPSSCWVLLGWALVFNLPIFLVVHNAETDLPFISRGILSRENVYLRSISDIAEIPRLWLWFAENKSLLKYFEK